MHIMFTMLDIEYTFGEKWAVRFEGPVVDGDPPSSTARPPMNPKIRVLNH
jgi:hypothetical protein